jgi:hypothetical protein
MKTTVKSISDYFPLRYDIAEGDKKGFAAPASTGLSADELIAWSVGKRLNALQTLSLLIKNAFEGHLCHLNGIPVESLVEHGTFHFSPEGEKAYRELAVEFFRDFEPYHNGLEIAWKNFIRQQPEAAGADFQSLLYFILAYQLFRLPASCLAEWDTRRFSAVSGKQREQYRFHYLLHISILYHVAQISYIEMVNQQYLEKFRELLLRLQSKEKVLMQVSTKLDYANDPAVQSLDQLERKYFEFLVAHNISGTPLRGLELFDNYAGAPEVKHFHELLKAQIKKLFKLISKNCSEVHTQTDSTESFQLLRKYFMAATSLYNEVPLHFSSLMLQYSRLILLFIKVVNFRKLNHLPVSMSDFTDIREKRLTDLNEEEVYTCQNTLKRALENQGVLHFTDFKSRYVKDDELAHIHQKFLESQIEFIDQKIKEVMEEIKLVMLKKTGVSN